MVGKQGFIRTMEAVIAILLVLGFLLYVLPRTQVLAESVIPEGLDSARSFILTEFLTNKTIRECVDTAMVNPDVDNSNRCTKATYGNVKCQGVIESLLNKHTPAGFGYHCEICPEVKPCTQVFTDKNKDKSIYPGSVFIYLSAAETKYVRVYFWRVS